MATGMKVTIQKKNNIRKENVRTKGSWLRVCLLLAVLLCLSGCGTQDENVLQVQSGTQTGQPQEETSGAAGTAGSQGTDTPGTVEENTKSAVVTVYVCGAVCQPGIYTLSGEVRMADAVEAAGGMRPDADINVLNLAQFISDGQMIRIPVQGETAGTAEAPSGEGDTQQQSQEEDKININEADAAELQKIPGIGQAKANAIVSYREEHGRFTKIEDIMQIEGIKEGSFAKMQDYICVQ